MKLKKISALALASGVALPGFAQQTEDTIEYLTVTGTHLSDQTAPARLAKVTVDAEQIAALAPNTFVDILRGIPGIDISEQGGVGGLSFLSIRGGDPNFVTVLIDGVRVNDPTNSRGGAFDFGTLDPAAIAKVEVFYGSYSTVFGSDALSGVVSIQTRQDEASVLAIKGGSGGMLGGSGHSAVSITDDIRLHIGAAHQHKDNSTFSDDFKRSQVNASLSSNPNADTHWRIGALYSDGESAYFPEDSGGERLAVIREPERRDYTQTNLGAQFSHWFNSKLSIKADGQWANRQEELINPGIAPGVLDPVPPITSHTNFDRYEATLVANYLYSSQFTLALGTGWVKEEGGMDSVIDFGFPLPANYRLNRTTNSIFAEAGFSLSPKWYFMLGSRYDDSEKSSVTTHRLLSRYQFSQAFAVSALYSEGFKLPGFFALAHPLIGNTELNPEHSENYDISIDFAPQGDAYSTRLSWYRNTYTDLVDFDPDLFSNVNRAKIEARGVELSGEYLISEFITLHGQVSYNQMDTYDPQLRLRRRPEWKGAFGLNYQLNEQISLTGRWSVNEGYYDSSVPTGMIKLDGYDRLDIGMRWQLNEQLQLRANGKNLLDDDFEESVGFDNGGRELTVSASYQF